MIEQQSPNMLEQGNMPQAPKQPKSWVGIFVILGICIVFGTGVAYAYMWNDGAIWNKIFQKDNADTGQNTAEDGGDTVVQLDAVNVDDFYLNAGQMKVLSENGFVVAPGYQGEFFELYEKNRYDLIPNFVTSDSILHNYHLMFDHLLKNLEEEKLIGVLKELNTSMLSQTTSQYTTLKNTQWSNAAQRNLGFFTVGAKLSDATVAVSPVVKDIVEQELKLIGEHKGIKESPVMNLNEAIASDTIDTPQGSLSVDANKEDYSQYIPRGHYDFNDQLKAYFKSMMWYGRLTFRFKEEDEIKSAVLVTLALHENAKAIEDWDSIYEPTNFFVGESDDITHRQLYAVLTDVYGADVNLQQVISDQAKFDELADKLSTMEGPQINSMPIFNSTIQPDREKEIKGFRFMGQRFTLDASIFQRLIDREVPSRMLPKGLDIPAAFGSDEALGILTEMKETEYENYPENMDKMRDYIKDLSDSEWRQNLYFGWMSVLHALVEVENMDNELYPQFMKTQAWARKNLNTFLGSWTELKHDTILYAKQVYAELGGGPDEPKVRDDRGYVEPNGELYSRLSALISTTQVTLQDRNLLTQSNATNLTRMKVLVDTLQDISDKQLHNEKITDDDYEFIRSYGGQLEHFWIEVFKDEMEKQGLGQRDFLMENPAALVADVATDPNGSVLEEATGHVFPIYVLIEIEGVKKIAKGGVYSYYEFTQPISERLTDKQWREKLDMGEAPALPAWTNSFIIANE